MVADLISVIVLYPMDLIKVQTQADSELTITEAINNLLKNIKNKGIIDSFSGLEGKLYVSPQQKLQYFYCNGIFKTLYMNKMNIKKLSTFEDLAIGYFSALEGLITTLPLSVTSARQIVKSKNKNKNIKDIEQQQQHQQIEKKKNFWTVFNESIKKDGFFAFYDTVSISAILCLNPAITYVLFDQIKIIILKRLNRPVDDALSTLEAFLTGALAKIVATLFTFPLIRANVMIRTWKKTHPESDEVPTFKSIFPLIIKNEGIGGLYKGLTPQLVKAVTNSALMLAIKERVQVQVKKLILGN